MTKQLHLYVGGPMRNKKLYNGPMFLRVARILREQGYRVVSPWEQDIEGGMDPTIPGAQQDFDIFAAFKWDFEAILSGGGIVLLPDWRKSPGVMAELVVAVLSGVLVFEWSDTAETICPLMLKPEDVKITWAKK